MSTKEPKTKLKPGRKPPPPPRRRRGRPSKTVEPIALNSAATSAGKVGASPGPTSRPARRKPLLDSQGARAKGSSLLRLREPDAETLTALGDAVAWARFILPVSHRTHRNASALAHHLSGLPRLRYDADLSIPIIYLAGAMGDDALRSTSLARKMGWDRTLNRVDLYARVKLAAKQICLDRSRSLSSLTHEASLTGGRVDERLKVRRARRGAARLLRMRWRMPTTNPEIIAGGPIAGSMRPSQWSTCCVALVDLTLR